MGSTGAEQVTRELLARLSGLARLTPATAPQRLAYLCSALLLVSAGVHAIVYAVDGGSWAGPVSWRKPIVFGLSFGITLATLAWLMSFLRPHRITAWVLLGILSAASVVEVFLVTLQRWRGVPSHFNESTPFNGLVFSIMGALVTVIVVLTVVITVRSFFPMDAPPSLALAIRAGLVLMLVSQAVGVRMIVEGGNTFGADGSLKVPHAVTLHALQVLPALALLLLAAETAERHRVRIVALGTLGYAGLITATMLQTFAGRAVFDLDLVADAVALAGFGLLLTSGLVALRGAVRQGRPVVV